MDKRILFGIVVLSILMISTVSALELNPFADIKIVEKEITQDMPDFIKADFNRDYGVIRLSKTFLWVETDKIAEYSLTENTAQCLINCYAKGKSVLYYDGALFEDILFKTKSGLPININSKYYLKGTEEYIVETPVYKETCEDYFDEKNGTTTKQCRNDLVDTLKETKTREVWNEYLGETLRAGEYEWKIEGTKLPAQSVDFIPVKSGKEFSEWAWWDASWFAKRMINITGAYYPNNSLIIQINNVTNMNVSSGYSDIRFIDATETIELGFWIDNKTLYNATNTTQVTSLVRMPNNASNYLYVYYNNPLVASKSNISNGFSLGDDFSGNTLSSYLWNSKTDAGTTISVSDGYVNISRVVSGGVGIASKIPMKGYAEVYMNGSTPANRLWMCAGLTMNSSILVSSSSSGACVGMGMIIGSAIGNQVATDGQRVYYNATYPMEQASTEQSAFFNFNGSISAPFTQFRKLIYYQWNSTNFFYKNFKDGNTKIYGPGIKQNNTNTYYFYTEAHQVDTNPSTIYLDWIIVRNRPDAEVGVTLGTEESPNELIVSSISPSTGYRSNQRNVTFNCTSTDETGVLNLSVTLNGAINYTINGGVGQNLTLTYGVNLSDGNYNWTCRGCDDATCLSSLSRTLDIDGTNPSIKGLNNITNMSTLTMPLNSTLYFNVSDVNIGTCKYYTSENVSNTTITCNSSFGIKWNNGGIKTVYAYVNDSFGNVNFTIGTLNIYDFNVTVSENGDPIAEGGQSSLYLRVNSTSFPIGDADASIMWNGTTSSPTTKSVLDTNTILFTYTFPISAGMGNSTGIPYAYNWTYNATQLTTRTTPTTTQTIISFGIDNCALYTTQIANFTLKDEETTAVLTPATKIEIETLTTSALFSGITWSYFNTFTNVSSIKLCVPAGVLNNTNYTIDITASYEGDNHVKEFWYLDNGTLAKNQAPFNSYTAVNVSLYDLLTTDSTTFLLEFTDKNGLEVPESIVHVYRKYIGEGTYREVERARQDNNGQTHVHLVEEDVIYYFTVSLEGRIIYTSDEYNAKCLATPCTITLSASPTDQNWSIIDNEGGRYAISMNRTSRIVRTTFSLDTLSLVNSSVYRFNNGNYSLINQSSLTATAGTIDVYIPVVYDNSSFFVAIYKDNVFIKSAWVSFRESAKDYFGTFGAILGGLIVLTMILMAVSEGAGLILFTIFGLIIITIMSLVDLGWASTISLICAGGIIIWKLMKRRNRA